MRTTRKLQKTNRLRRFAVEALERRDNPVAFTAGNLVVYRVGDGAAALSANGNAVFLDEFLPTGSGQTPQQSIALPTTGGGAITAGTSTLEGFMNLSPDSQYLAITGFNVPLPNGSSITSSTAARVVAVADKTGTVTISNLLTDYAVSGAPRGAATVNGKSFWVSGSNTGSYRYVANPSDTTSVSLTNSPGTPRQIQIAGGQLYGAAQSGAFRVFTIGTGLPTVTGQTSTNLPGTAIPALGDPNSMFFADLSISVAGLDTLYVADSSAGVAGGVKKFTYDGTNWLASGSIQITLTGNNPRALTGVVNGANIDLYGANGTTLFTLTDTSGYNGTITGTPTSLATAGTNTAFRGVSFAPRTATSATVDSLTPNVGSTTGPSVTYTQTLSSAIAGLTASNFTLITTGTATGTVGTPTTGDGGLTWSIPVTGITGLGTIRLDTVNSTGVTPPLTNLTYNGGVVTVTTTNSILDVSSKQAIFSAGLGKLNNVTLSISGGTYTINDTLQVINLTANAIAEGWTGNGTNTVTGPDANTNSLLIAMGAGADTFTLDSTNDPVTVTGDTIANSVANFAKNVTLAGAVSVTGFDSITQNVGVVLSISDVTLGGNTVGTGVTPINTKSTNVTATVAAGGLFLTENDGASFTLTATGAGAINVTNTTGTLTVGGASTFGSGPVSLSSGDGVAINAALGDLLSSGTVTIAANTDGAGNQGFTMSAAGTVRTLDAGASAFTLSVNTGGGGTGDATVNNIQVGQLGSVTINVNAGSIFGTATNVINAGGGINTLPGSITLSTSGAASAIGTTGQHLILKTGNLSANAGSGGVYLEESSDQDMKINLLTATGAGEVYLKCNSGSNNGLQIAGLVNTGSGNITLSADDTLQILFTGSIGDGSYSGKMEFNCNTDGDNQQTYQQAAGTLVQTTSTDPLAIVINVSAATNAAAAGGAILGNIKTGAGGGLTVNCAKTVGINDANRAGYIEMVDSAALLDVGSNGTVTLIAKNNYIGKSGTPIMATAGTISAVTNSVATSPLMSQQDADVFVTTTGAANFSGQTTDAGTHIGDLTFTTLAGAMTLNGDVKTDTGDLKLNSAAGINQSAGKLTTLGIAAFSYSGIATLSTAGNSAATLTLAPSQELRVDGTATLTNPLSVDGTLSGGGTLNGKVNLTSTGKVAPGTSPGKLGTGDIVFVASSQFVVELNGNTAGVSYDQLAVAGTVDLGNATLVGSVGGPITPGSTLTIIDNDGTIDLPTGTFNGYAEGATVTIGATNFTISYKGGDGNDVTLKAPGAGSPPTVSTVVPNGGGAQRSNVFSIVVTFSESVTFSGPTVNAFTLTRANAPLSATEQPGVNGKVNIVATPAAGPTNTITLTFATSGAEPVFGVSNVFPTPPNSFTGYSLPDGTYNLAIDGTQITGVGGNMASYSQTGSSASGDKLFRLFGDLNGDGGVSNSDFNAFKVAFGSGVNVAFDYNNDGDVANNDFNQLKTRFGSSLP